MQELVEGVADGDHSHRAQWAVIHVKHDATNEDAGLGDAATRDVPLGRARTSFLGNVE